MTTQYIAPEIVEKHAETILSAIASATIREVILREYLDDSQVCASVTLIFDNGTTISIADTVSSYPIADTLPGQRVTAVVASRNEDGYWGSITGTAAHPSSTLTATSIPPMLSLSQRPARPPEEGVGSSCAPLFC